jgi:phosphate starvation-inducible PhoH-like protein
MSKQRKTHNDLSIEFSFKSEAQRQAWQLLEEKDIVFLLGPAGTGRTFLSVAYALDQVIRKRYGRIVLTRPIVESGEKLGHLPGEVGDKIRPFMTPVHDAMDRLLGNAEIKRAFVEANVIERPLAYMRGVTFVNSVCILDEAQNCTLSQLRLYLSRYGANSKIIVNGDMDQVDIRDSGFEDVANRLSDLEEVGVVRFGPESIVRHPVVGKILARLR